MVSLNSRIGIVGAGTSGVYLANLLLQQGFQVTVFEKAPYPRTEGCGIFLVQAGMEALHQGNPEICNQIIHAGSPVRCFEFRNLRGDVISSESVTNASHELPGMLVHRTAILEALLRPLPPECLHCGVDLQSITQTAHSVTAHFKDGSEWEGDLLVGADGIVSKVRQFVVPGVELCYLGDLVWRGVVTDKVFCPEGNFIVYVRGRGIYANFFDIGGDRTHWGFFIEKDLEDSERGSLRPQNSLIPARELAKLPKEARAVIEATPPEHIVSRYSYDIPPLPRLCQGRIVLIGDAAHAKSPTRARGMTAGFEDALSLVRHLVSSAQIEVAVEAYQTERKPIVHEYQRTSREMSQKIGRRHKQAA
ncbi:FAD-dependent monooxygenase [Leptothermofonsia sichuanensis E412]|uniref:FAD-dependent oxidoreductase n=1 Tax=Leptothermofonsia sichuanensis TaxID=2917832 RepID=UPI001CA6145F|nr:FAD-dependent monooxygenase [Leptothermofonsia sichuanensis]QZZ18639.1 FAD-dependent monooxygenase [Leptothermofonsia sichuanensis E412]